MDKDFDAIIVGLGPVGSFMALLLESHGLKVLAIDKDKDIYDLPRAVSMSDQGLRMAQTIGLEAIYLDNSSSVGGAGFVDKDLNFIGQSIDFNGIITPNGWPPMRLFHQPYTDKAIRKNLLNSNCTVLLEHELTNIVDHTNHVEVSIMNNINSQQSKHTGSFLIGADGGSSKTRRILDIKQEDLDYNRDWIVIDVKLNGEKNLDDRAMQICDPERLGTYIPAHPPFKRWEFLILNEEDKIEITKDSKIHELLSPWLEPNEYEIIRKAIYQFHSVLSEEFCKGNCFLLGDAAHQNPPFMGEGMMSGYRDATNLAWKIALIINKGIHKNLLNTYQTERKPHAKFVVENSAGIGELMEAYAATEDPNTVPKELVAKGYGSFVLPNLQEGLFYKGKADETTGAGQLFPQPIKIKEGVISERLDSLLGNGFALVSKKQIVLKQEDHNFMSLLDTSMVVLDQDLLDQNFWLTAFLDLGEIFLIRPDKNVFGSTSGKVSLEDLINDLRNQINDN